MAGYDTGTRNAGKPAKTLDSSVDHVVSRLVHAEKKGILAAMMLVHVRAVFRQAVRETHEPHAIVARLASAVYEDTRGDSYLTCIVVRVDDQDRRLTATVAGHPAALILGTGLRRVSTGGPPVGLFPDARYEEETADLVAGDRIVVVTDGITEHMTDFEAAVAGLNDHPSADAMCGSIFELSQSQDDALPVPAWDDDRTVLVMAVD